jgi:hypothetical protein
LTGIVFDVASSTAVSAVGRGRRMQQVRRVSRDAVLEQVETAQLSFFLGPQHARASTAFNLLRLRGFHRSERQADRVSAISAAWTRESGPSFFERAAPSNARAKGG